MISFRLRPVAHPLPVEERLARMEHPGFGKVFTEHMVSLRWSAGRGWHDAWVRPYESIPLDPAFPALHYGQAVFEGLKVYRCVDGSARVFRPDEHARRFARSARRMAMPELPPEIFVQAIDELVRVDLAWLPDDPEMNLYLRPVMFGTNPSLAVEPAREYRFLVIASVVDRFFESGPTPITVWISEEYTRAADRGTGAVKCAGNYGAAFLAQQEAVENGCDQVVWLDPHEHRWVEEAGAMNLFFVERSDDGPVLFTPPLTGSLLAGVTRASILELAPDLGMRVREAAISVGEWRDRCADGSITEVFACGTAARIVPVGEMRSASGGWRVGNGTTGPVTAALSDALFAIQQGKGDDRHGWMRMVPDASADAGSPEMELGADIV